MTRWNEPLALSQSSDVRVYAVRFGRKTQLVVHYSSHDEGVLEAEWPSILTAGCYGLEISGTIEDEGRWRMYADGAIEVTAQTEKGGESVTMTADSFDVKAVITVCVGTTGVTEELRQEIADMIEEEYNASERVRESNEADRQAAETIRQQNEETRVQAEQQREQDAAAAIGGAEQVNAELEGTVLTVTNRNGESSSVDTKGEKGEKGEKGDKGDAGEQGVSGGMLFPTMNFDPETGVLTIRGLEEEIDRISYNEETAELIIKL